MDRRDFLTMSALNLTAFATSSAFDSHARAQIPQENNVDAVNETGGDSHPEDWPERETQRRGDMLYHKLGSTGEWVSAIGMGGSHLGDVENQTEATRLVHRAVDHGLTFMDNCWDYHNGKSEQWMGNALHEGNYRKNVFLMSKVDGRSKAVAMNQIDESLKRLKTDHVDLMQFHEVIRLEDPDRIFSEGGAAEAFLDAKKAGKIRFIGFTGHKDPHVHLRMLETAAKHGFKFDTVQMPLNVMDAHFRSFEKLVLPRLVKENIGVLGMKSMASGFILKSKVVSAVECLQYALTLPTSVVITGIDSLKILEQDLAVVRDFKPLNKEQIRALLAKTAKVAATGRFEPFKTNNIFDSTAHHPEWVD